jgi:amino acid adenylation domain-containing protein/thioester reductase-like protein
MTINHEISRDRLKLSAAKQALLEKRLRGKLTKKPEIQTIPRRTKPGPGPLSFAQQRLWFIEQFEGDSPTYNIPFGFRLKGALNISVLERCFNEIVQRHETLRTAFRTVKGQPVKIIAQNLPIRLYVNDLRHLPPDKQDSEVQRLTLEDARHLFDLAQYPLFRISLLRLAEEDYFMLMTIHHTIYDGWSIGVFMKELTTLYEAFSAGKPSPLPELPVQYSDFAQWQREWLRGEVLDQQLSYWKKQLSDSLPVLELPTDRSRPARQTFCGDIHTFRIPPPLVDTLKAFGQQEKCTLFMILLAAFNILLYRYSGQEDILIGSPVANRHRSELEGLIGFFVNILVLRTDLSGNPTFLELLGRIRKIILEAQAHQDIPFDLLVEELHPERNLSHHPLYQVAFAIRNATEYTFTLPDITVEPILLHNGTAKVDLFLEIVETNRGITGIFEYNIDLFDAVTIGRMTEHFQTLLEGIASDPEQTISEIPILTEVERQQILVEWNNTHIDYPKDTCLHELFEIQVKRAPDAIAVVFEDTQLTYRELNCRANQLAHYLQKLGVGPETLVGICIERSLEMIVGILGILKSGGAYVPLDPAYPKERLAFMLSDAQVPILLTQEKLILELPNHNTQIICLDTDWGKFLQESEDNPVNSVTPENLAYVIYTSGSTGIPKGVLITHQGLCNVSEAQIRTFDLNSSDRILQFSSLSFDAATFDIVMALRVGAILYLGTRENILPGPNLLQFLQNFEITITTLPPSALAILPVGELSTLRIINVAGDACSPDLVKRWAKDRLFFNLYGPTETTIWATVAQCTDSNRIPPIGRPIDNTQIYILNRHLQPVPIGVPGELHIGGVGLARGYLNRPELTKEKFISNPFSDKPGACLYKTGDLARYLPDGNIEFIGRIDNQVKIRGFRIELGEIETVLTKHPDIREVVVIALETPSGDKQLAAYLVPHQKKKITVNELHDFLKKQLPDYMIPTTFTFLDALPLTPNGKVDRRALPEPDTDRPELTEKYIAPRTPAEKTMADIWSGLLHIDQFGVHDNFFELGGHSLLAVQLISEIEHLFQVKLPLWKLFESPTIAGLVRAMQEEQWQGPEKVALETQIIDGFTEATLDEAIPPKGTITPLRSVTDYKHIFLTGATGFLGAFLLYELLQQSRANIYCLVRSSDIEEGRRRIRDNLERYFLWHEQLASRIVPVPGDLSQSLLGLSPGEFDEMARRIEFIYHSGAVVNLVYPYSTLKPANVLGTQEILRLASLHTVKPVHYVSTVAVFPLVQQNNDAEPISEDTPLDAFDKLHIGYSQSKWVAEKLIATAYSRGIPCSIYRPSRIAGHSQTGLWNTSDFACRMLKGWIQMGVAPQQDTIENWVPVDYVSRAIVHLSQQEMSQGQVFHLINPKPIHWNELVDWICAFGYPLRKLPYSRWRKEFIERAAENALTPLMALFQDPEKFAEPQRFSCWNTFAGLEGTSITCPPVDTALLHTYFAYFLRSRFLEPPQVRS